MKNFKQAPKHPVLRQILFWISLIIAAGLILSAYAGWISPVRAKWAGLAVMTFPAWILVSVVWTVLSLFFSKRAFWVGIVGIVASIGPILSFCPLNIVNGKLNDYEKSRTFTLLTYNVLDFVANNDIYPDGTNATLGYILESDADIVALQESLSLKYPVEKYHITKRQIDSLNTKYPHRHLVKATMILSKFPFTPVEIAKDSIFMESVAVGDFDIYGKKIRLYNMHLESFRLTPEDKVLYRDITKLEVGGKGKEVKEQLIHKLVVANSTRARQVQALCREIKRNPAENVIVCGDFNDVPNCYALRKLSALGFEQVYPKLGFGPVVTYNSNRFLFRIDHILYKGELRPVGYERETIKSSDHYPQLVTFTVE